MSEFAEKITLDLDGTAVDGSAARGLGKTSEASSMLMGELKKLAAFVGAEESLRRMVTTGFEFNAQLESSRLAIVALVQTFNTVGGSAVTFAQATQEAEKAQLGLRVAALHTQGTLTELTDLFQTLYPAAVSRGMNTEQVVRFTIATEHMAAAMHVSLQRATKEMEMFLATGMGMGILGSMFKSMGVTMETLQQWKVAGTTFENMMKIMKSFEEMGPRVAQTWQGAIARLGNTLKELLGSGFQEAFDAAKVALLSFTEGMVKVSKSGFVFDPELLARVKEFGHSLAEIIKVAAPLGAELFKFGLTAAKALAGAIETAGPLFTVLTGLLKLITPLVDKFGEWALIIWAGVKAQAAMAAAFPVLAGAAGLAATGMNAFIVALSAVGIPTLLLAIVAVAGLKKAVDDFYGSWANAADETTKATLLMNVARKGDDAAIKGNAALAASYDDLYKRIQSGVTKGMAALQEFKTLGGGLNITPLAPLADPKFIEQQAEALAKLRGEIAQVGTAGLSQKLAGLDAEQAVNDLKFMMEKMMHVNKEELAKIGEVQDQANALTNAKRQEAYREAAADDAKRLLDVRKFWDDAHLAALSGVEKEKVTLDLSLRQEIAKIEHEIQFTKLKGKEKSDFVAEEKSKELALRGKYDAQITELERKTYEEIGKQGRAFDVEKLRAQGEDYLAALKEVENKGIDDLQAWAEKFGSLLADPFADPAMVSAAVDLFAKLTAASKASGDKVVRDNAVATAGMTGNWAAYWDEQKRQIAKGAETFSEGLANMAAEQYRWAVTMADGVNAALLKIRSELKTEGQIWSDYLTGIWSGITKGLGDALLVLETGTGTIKDALKGILNSLLQSFNQMVVEMVKRWVLGLGQMKDASSGSGGLGSLFAGAGQLSSIDAQGNVVYHGGTINTVAKGQGTQGVVTQAPSGSGVANVVGAGVTGLGVGSLVGSTSGAPGFSTGAAIGGAVAGAGIALAAAGAFGAVLAGAAAGSVVPIIGTIIGAIIGGLIAVLSSSNTEAKVWGTNLAPQLKTAGEAIQASVVDVYTKSLLPDTAGFAKSVNTIIKGYLSHAMGFEVHAGSSEDIKKDIQTLLSGIIPTELLHTLIGQQRTGGQDVAGISGASKYGGALDPNAPINKMLTDLGFTAAKVQELAGQIDTMAPADWMKMLEGLVGVVAGAKTLGEALSKTYAETIAGVDAEAAKSPAGKLADRLTGVTDLLKAVSFYTGTEQITKGQEALAAAQQFYNDAKTAMVQLDAMAKQVTLDVQESTKKVLDALKTPAELAAQSVQDLQHDYERMRFAANPEDLAKAWASARTDFEAVAGELVNRIKQIKTLLDDIHTLQAAMATGPAIDMQTDPKAWLAKSTADMEKYRLAMVAASPGSPEQIAAATSFAGLIRDRYQMELDLLGRVESTIASINASIGASITDLQLKGMGSVVDGKWVADIHAQGEFMMSQITALQAQLKTAQTPEEVQRLVSQIQALVGQLGGQQQDPTHYAESLQILQQILEETRKAAEEKLKGMEKAAKFDISTLGPKLAQAETIMSAALTQANYDLDALVFHFQSAATFATGALNAWGVQIANQLNDLGPILAAMVTNFTDVNTALSGSGGGPGGGHGPDLPGNLTALGSGVDDARGALLDFTAAVKAGTQALAG